MGITLQLGNLAVDVVQKDIKNVHLSVHPPNGRVRISAPLRMSMNTIRVFAISKLNWIKEQQRKLREQDREPVREYLNRESHFVWGKRYLLQLNECDQVPSLQLKHTRLLMFVRPGTSEVRRHEIMESWYREQVRNAVPGLITKWEPMMKVSVARFHVQRMRTRWGSCNPVARSIRLNTDLAKKPRECLEYIVVHEMLHLLEPTHNARFVALMDQFMPRWHVHREMLNLLPVRHDEWDY